MNKTRLIASILLLFIVAQQSNASMLVQIRKLVAVEPELNGTKISPTPAPISDNKTNHQPDLGNTGTEKPQPLPLLDNSPFIVENGSNVPAAVPDNSSVIVGNDKPKESPLLNNSSDTVGNEKPKESPLPDNSSVVAGNGSNVPAVGKSENTTQVVAKDLKQDVTDEKCEAAGCVQKPMIACLKYPQNGSSVLFILIQNEGETVLNVSVTVPASVAVSAKELEIPQGQAKKINASGTVGDGQKIVLNAGNGDCVLYTGLTDVESNIFRRIPYADNVTPMHGAYLMFLVVVIVGGSWACCKFVKKRPGGNSEVPYQEIEMALPESVPAVDVDAENGWDQGWDDDWDEERAVRSPGKHLGNMSANGLTSRSSNKDGWGSDWDD